MIRLRPILRSLLRVISVVIICLLANYISAQEVDTTRLQHLQGEPLVVELNRIAVKIRTLDLQASYDYSLRAMEEAEACGYKNGWGVAVKNIGVVYYFASENRSADSCYSIAIKCFEEVGDDLERSRCLNNRALIQLDVGDLDGAIATYLDLEKFYSSRDNESDLCNILTNHASALYWKGDYPQALNLYVEAYSIANRLHDTTDILNATVNIGALFTELEHFEKAFPFLEEALELAILADNNYSQAKILVNLSDVYFNRGEKEIAMKLIYESQAIRNAMGLVSGLSSCDRRLGVIQHADMDYGSALTSFTRSLKLDQEAGDTIGCAISLRCIAKVLSSQKKYAEAEEYLYLSLQIAEEFGALAEVRNTLFELASLTLETHDLQASFEYYDRFITISESLSTLDGVDLDLSRQGKDYKGLEVEMNQLMRDNNSVLYRELMIYKYAFSVVVLFLSLTLLFLLWRYIKRKRDKLS